MTIAPQAELTIDVAVLDGTATVAVGGELDLQSAPRLREVLVETLGDPAHRELEVDLAGLTFIDSTGLGVLVGTHRRLTASGRSLIVRRPRASTYRVLELSGLSKTFVVVDPPVLD